MKIFVKTLKGSQFEIQVKPEDSVADVKKSIETVHGSDVYPAAQQMLIYQGKVLKDGTTLIENNVAENSFVVIMLSKSKSSSGVGSTTSTAPVPKASQTSVPPPTSAPALAVSQPPVATSAPPASTPAPAPAAAPISSVAVGSEANVYDNAASNLVAGNNLEGAIQQILDMGGGTWDRDTVIRALRAAYNNPERAVEYLYSDSHVFFDEKGQQS